MSWLSSAWDSFTGKKAQKEAQRVQLWLHQQQVEMQKQQAAMAAEQQRQLQLDEQRRQNNIRTGQSAIDQAFSQFNDNYYSGARDQYASFYLPQLAQQEEAARNKMVAQLAERGMLESTTGAGALGRLTQRAADQRANIGNDAANFAESLRKQVLASKNALYDVNRTAADPSAVASQATGQATTLAQAPGGFERQQINNVFSDMLTPIATAFQASRNYVPSGYRPSAPAGGGSVRNY